MDCGLVRLGRAEEQNAFGAPGADLFRPECCSCLPANPDEAAMEQVFTAKMPQAPLKLGQARGVAVAACAAHGLMFFPITSLQACKNSLTGVGSAGLDKETGGLLWFAAC